MKLNYVIMIFAAAVSLCAEAYTFRVRNTTNNRVVVILNEIGRQNRNVTLEPHTETRINTGIFCVNSILAYVPEFVIGGARRQDSLDLQGNACRGRNFVIRSRTMTRNLWIPTIDFNAPQRTEEVESIYIQEE
ncbi:hypothetical protein Noda2021_11720 [Candidatus Dependentiae bacterium Noda2021]|nr:hypothetical protein Noda2021_11720 [Candidatus Dependentiae bacterium Noda2021]